MRSASSAFAACTNRYRRETCLTTVSAIKNVVGIIFTRKILTAGFNTPKSLFLLFFFILVAHSPPSSDKFRSHGFLHYGQLKLSERNCGEVSSH